MDKEGTLYKSKPIAPIAMVALEGAKGLCSLIDAHLVRWAKEKGEKVVTAKGEVTDVTTRIKPGKCPRFASGDGKGILEESVRGCDLFFVVDIGNYSCTYELFGKQNLMSPDDHFQDLKRLIQAASGKAHRLNVIMPLLYGGRQHRRNYRESLDCAVALQELERMGVSNIITFDAHDPRVSNAVPLMGFDNITPSYQVLKTLFRTFPYLKISRDTFMVVSPDEGALNRNMYYASVLEVELGMFYKRRDYSRIVSGMNPIAAHEYLGGNVADKTVFIADDIISSGKSVLDIAIKLKSKGAARVVAYATYSIFTHGLDTFDKAHADGIIDYVFGTNLTYIPDELLARPWFREVDVSKYIAYLMAGLNCDLSTEKVIDPHFKIEKLLEKSGVKRTGV